MAKIPAKIADRKTKDGPEDCGSADVGPDGDSSVAEPDKGDVAAE